MMFFPSKQAPTPAANSGVYPVALIPAASIRKPPAAQGGMVTGNNYRNVAQPMNQTIVVDSNVSNTGLNNVRNMSQNIVTGVGRPTIVVGAGNYGNNQQRPAMPSTQGGLSYAASPAQSIHSRGEEYSWNYCVNVKQRFTSKITEVSAQILSFGYCQ